MSTIRLLAFDYGKKFIGVAVGNTTSGTAQGLTALRGKNHSPDWDKIDQLFQEWQPDALVLGLPLNMDGTDTGITPQVRKFGDKLKDRYNRPVHMVDERLSSQTAKNRLTETGVSLKRSNKSKIDMLAAQTILQSFLDDHAGIELG